MKIALGIGVGSPFNEMTVFVQHTSSMILEHHETIESYADDNDAGHKTWEVAGDCGLVDHLAKRVYAVWSAER